MDEAGITRYIETTFAGVDVIVASKENGAPEVAWGDSFFIYDPDRNLPEPKRFPFATIVTQDYGDFDNASNLNRPGVFRLNVGSARRRSRSSSAPRVSTTSQSSIASCPTRCMGRTTLCAS